MCYIIMHGVHSTFRVEIEKMMYAYAMHLGRIYSSCLNSRSEFLISEKPIHLPIGWFHNIFKVMDVSIPRTGLTGNPANQSQTIAI